MPEQNKILLHSCCGICSGYPITLLKEMGYEVVAYFYNPNIYPAIEYEKRLQAEQQLCKAKDVQLIVGDYEIDKYYTAVKGLENEPEKGLRCDKCFALRLEEAAIMAQKLGIKTFTTSMVISPHKNFDKLSQIGNEIAQKYDLSYLAIDFKKKDGFLKTNKIAKELNLYRQNYCGCQFSL